jgi:adenylate cyclase
MAKQFIKIFGLIIFLACLNICGVFAQSNDESLNRKLDSLKSTNLSDSSRVNLLSSIATAYRSTNYEEAKKYLHDAISLAEKINFQPGLITAYEKLGKICGLSGEYDSAIYFHLKCLDLREAANDQAGMAITDLNLGLVYLSLNDSAKARFYFQKGLNISKKYHDVLTEAKAEENFGKLYNGYQKFDLARSYYIKALHIFIALNDKEEQANVYNNVGGAYYYEGEHKKALSYFLLAEKIYQEFKNEHALADLYDNIGGVYQKINIDSALYYLNKALILAKKTGSSNTEMEIYGNLTAYFEKIHDDKNAYQNYRLYTDLKDSFFSVDKSKAIAELQTKYDTEKDQEKIASLTGARKFDGLLRNSLIIFIGMVLVIVIVLYSRYRFEIRTIKTIRAEKSRSDELLLNILPSETAEELKKYGKTTARGYDEISVLFADIKGFTIIAEQMSAQDLVADLDQYFGSFDLITARYGMEKIKTIGDAYLCAGGLPDATKGTPAEVIKAALEMQQCVEKIKQEKILKNEPYFEIRVGVNTGPLVAGVVGIKKFAYDIWGDTVNTAARIQQNCETGKVNISATTYEKIKDSFNCTFRGNIEAKNKGLIAMYYVDGVKQGV